MEICKFCYKNNLKNLNAKRQHEVRCLLNPNRKIHHLGGPEKGTVPWNKGLTKEDNPVIARPSLRGKAFGLGLSGHTIESRRKLSVAAKKNNLGGHTSKQKLYFKKKDLSEVYLQSSYEVEFATILEELNIKWSRPEPLKWIDINGESHKYYPDFKIGDVYIDTKNNYLAVKDLPKIMAVKEQNDVDLRMVTKDQITKEFIASLV